MCLSGLTSQIAGMSIYLFAYIYMLRYAHICMYVSVYVCMCLCMYVCVCVCMYVSVYAGTKMYMYDVYVCINEYLNASCHTCD